MKRIMAIAFLIYALSGIAPAVADEVLIPAGGSTQPISRSVTTVSGAEAVSTMIEQFEGAEFGSSAATVTLDVDGTSTPVVIEYAGLMGETDDGEGGGLMRFGALGVAAGVFVKFLGLLMRLGRG